MLSWLKHKMDSLVPRAVVTSLKLGKLQLAQVKIGDLLLADVPRVQEFGLLSLPKAPSEAIGLAPEGDLDNAMILSLHSEDVPDCQPGKTILHHGKNGARIVLSEDKKATVLCDSLRIDCGPTTSLKISKDGKVQILANNIDVFQELVNAIESLAGPTVQTTIAPNGMVSQMPLNNMAELKAVVGKLKVITE